MRINKTELQKKKIAFLESLEISSYVKDACERASISRATYYRWIQEDEHFKKQVEERIETEFSLAKQVMKSSTIDVIEELRLICLGKTARIAQVNAINSWLDRVGIVAAKEAQEENSLMFFIDSVRDDTGYEDQNQIHTETVIEGLGIYAPPLSADHT